MGALTHMVGPPMRRWRAFRGITQWYTDGRFPLELLLSEEGPPPRVQEIEEVRSGLIPVRCLDTLEEYARGRARWARMVWVFALFPAFFATMGILGSPDPESPHTGSVRWFVWVFSLPVVGLLLTSQWWRVWRDVRGRRLAVEEGELTRKWTHHTHRRRYPEPPSGLLERVKAEWASLLKEDEYVPEVNVQYVRIARRTLEVGSVALFNQLGTGVRYRMYLSAHAGRLIAIESVEREVFAGYRDAPARAPRLAPMSEPEDQAERSRP